MAVLNYEVARDNMIDQIRKANEYLPPDFNEKAAKIFGCKPDTIRQYRMGTRFNLEVGEYIIATAQVIQNRIKSATLEP